MASLFIEKDQKSSIRSQQENKVHDSLAWKSRNKIVKGERESFF